MSPLWPFPFLTASFFFNHAVKDQCQFSLDIRTSHTSSQPGMAIPAVRLASIAEQCPPIFPNYGGILIARPQTVQHPALYNKFSGDRQTPHKVNALKFLILSKSKFI